mmetsp:Transcript_17352/g.36032  ORF Transcript_17352/g.36032 Transcript_17352/m.36032 type:complete len:140 (+) Transcript_17352:1953-2372(+)
MLSSIRSVTRGRSDPDDIRFSRLAYLSSKLGSFGRAPAKSVEESSRLQNPVSLSRNRGIWLPEAKLKKTLGLLTSYGQHLKKRHALGTLVAGSRSVVNAKSEADGTRLKMNGENVTWLTHMSKGNLCPVHDWRELLTSS